MRLLIVSLPAYSGHVVACAFNETVTTEIDCFVVNVNEVDMRVIPANPGEQHRVLFSPTIGANLVEALREMLMRGQE